MHVVQLCNAVQKVSARFEVSRYVSVKSFKNHAFDPSKWENRLLPCNFSIQYLGASNRGLERADECINSYQSLSMEELLVQKI